MAAILPIGTIPGLTSSLDAVDILLGTFATAQTVTVGVLRHTNYDDGGATDTSVVGAIRNAAAGGGDAIAFTIPDQTQSVVPAGSITVAAGGSLYLRVTTGSASMNLTGWVNLADGSGLTTALTSLARVKAHLDISGSTHDADLTTAIDGASDEVQKWLGRSIVQATATGEKYGASGVDHRLMLRRSPIVSITTLTEDGTALVENTNFELTAADKAAGVVVRLTGSGGDATSWPSGTRHIVVTYSHGYATIPEALAKFTTELVVFDWRQTVKGGGRLGLDSKALESGGASGYSSRDALWRAWRTRLWGYRGGLA